MSAPATGWGTHLWGEAPRPRQLALAVLAAAGATALWGLSLPALPAWRAALACALFFDVAAGVVANLTRSTSDFYWARPTSRWVFLAVHWHLAALAWLLGDSVAGGVAACGVALAAGGLVNALGGNRVVAGAGLVVGLAVLNRLSLSPALALAAQLFLVKVGYAFAVNHSRQEEERR